MSRDEGTVLDILRAARLATEFLGDLDPRGFRDDIKTQSSVIHQLLILGEAVKRISSNFRETHPEIPWRQIAGMRDVMLHAYDKVDLEEIWSAVRRDIPKLIAGLQPLVAEFHDSDVG